MAAPILWAPGKCALSAGKPHVHKIPWFGEGGIFNFGLLGLGGVPILFLWARGFF